MTKHVTIDETSFRNVNKARDLVDIEDNELQIGEQVTEQSTVPIVSKSSTISDQNPRVSGDIQLEKINNPHHQGNEVGNGTNEELPRTNEGDTFIAGKTLSKTRQKRADEAHHKCTR